MRFGLGLGLGMTSAAPLSLSPASTSVNMGSTQTFTAAGGTPGYTYSLHTNNSGGSIDSSTGVYTPGWTPGVDTVRVTDSLGHTADSTATAVFAPAALSGTLAVYDSSLGITLVSGQVDTWTDVTGDATHTLVAVAHDASHRPNYNATDAAYNNKPTLQADPGVGFQAMVADSWGTSTPQPVTHYVVGQLATDTAGFLVGGPNGGNNSIANASTPTKWEIVSGSAYVDSAVSPASPAVVCGVFNGASSKIYVTDHTTASGSGNPGTNPQAGSEIFAVNGGGVALGKGKLAFWLIRAGADDATTRGHIFTALGATYGLSVT